MYCNDFEFGCTIVLEAHAQRLLYDEELILHTPAFEEDYGSERQVVTNFAPHLDLDFPFHKWMPGVILFHAHGDQGVVHFPTTLRMG